MTLRHIPAALGPIAVLLVGVMCDRGEVRAEDRARPCAALGDCRLDREPQVPVETHVGSWSAVAIAGSPGRSAMVEVSSGGDSNRIELPIEMVRINEMRIDPLRRRLVVSAMVGGDAHEIAIIDLNTRRVIDEFLALHPAISPNGRYVAYVRHYPQISEVWNGDYYLLYDTAGAPSAQRIVIDGGSEAGREIRFDERARPVDASGHRFHSFNFVWNERSSAVQFLDRSTTPEAPPRLVDVRIGANGGLAVSRSAIRFGTPQASPCVQADCRGHLIRVGGRTAFTETGDPRTHIRLDVAGPVAPGVP